MSDAVNDAVSALPAASAQAFVAQSRDLLAASDAAGELVWCNDRFAAATGLARGDAWPPADVPALVALAGRAFASPAGAQADRSLASPTAAQADGSFATSTAARHEAIALRFGAVPMCVEASVARAGARTVWTLVDVTHERALAASARRQGELLDMAQEFGRLGFWEREIPSGEGRWDKHVFGFWGLDPKDGTPNYAEAIQRIHPEDRARMTYGESTKRAGRYVQRYRVVHPDGKTRWIQSQWEVKNGSGGVPERTVGFMVDDTEAHEAARALSDVNAQLKMAVEVGKVVVWKHDLRTDRMHYDDRGFELLGVTPCAEGLSLAEARSSSTPRTSRSSSPRRRRRWRPTCRPMSRRAIAGPTGAGATC